MNLAGLMCAHAASALLRVHCADSVAQGAEGIRCELILLGGNGLVASSWSWLKQACGFRANMTHSESRVHAELRNDSPCHEVY